MSNQISRCQSFVHAQKTVHDQFGPATDRRPFGNFNKTFPRPLCDCQFFLVAKRLHRSCNLCVTGVLVNNSHIALGRWEKFICLFYGQWIQVETVLSHFVYFLFHLLPFRLLSQFVYSSWLYGNMFYTNGNICLTKNGSNRRKLGQGLQNLIHSFISMIQYINPLFGSRDRVQTSFLGGQNLTFKVLVWP